MTPSLCALTAAPSFAFSSLNTMVDTTVHAPEGAQREVNAVDHLRRRRARMIGNEQRGGERGRGDAEAHGHLLHRARDGARAARLFVGHVGVGERVHAGVLGRGEEIRTRRRAARWSRAGCPMSIAENSMSITPSITVLEIRTCR